MAKPAHFGETCPFWGKLPFSWKPKYYSCQSKCTNSSIDLENSEAIALKILEHDSVVANEKNIEQMQDKLKQTKDYRAKTELTKEIDNTRKAFDNVVYGYAITVHKSQGSTFERVFVDVNNIYQSNTKQKMLYTAVTRASSSIHVYGDFSEEGQINIDTLFD